MRDETFTLDPATSAASPPFSYTHVAHRRSAFWRITGAAGREIGRANTRAGARLAVRELYDRSGQPRPVPGFKAAGSALPADTLAQVGAAA